MLFARHPDPELEASIEPDMLKVENYFQVWTHLDIHECEVWTTRGPDRLFRAVLAHVLARLLG
jgi:hypothetical protein